MHECSNHIQHEGIGRIQLRLSNLLISLKEGSFDIILENLLQDDLHLPMLHLWSPVLLKLHGSAHK